jgi:hypothetical protein
MTVHALDFDSLSESQIRALAYVAFHSGGGQGLYKHVARSLVDRELLLEINRDECGWRWTEYRMPQHVADAFASWSRTREWRGSGAVA